MNRNKWTYITVLLISILLLSLICGCNSQLSSTRNSTGKTDVTTEGYKDTAEATVSKASSSKQSSIATDDRKVIFTAALSVETTNFTDSITVLEKMISDFEGYIQSSSVETGTSYQSTKKLRSASYEIRIPSDKLKSFLSKSGDIGNIILNTTQGEDVTDKFYDTQARLDALTIQEERLMELLKKASTMQDIITLEDRISTVRYEIEQLTGTLNKLSSLVSLSTVTIKIAEVETITKPEPEGFLAQLSNTFSGSIQALIRTLRELSIVIVAVLPFLVVFGLIILIIVLIVRRATRKKRLEAKRIRQNYAYPNPGNFQNSAGMPAANANNVPTGNVNNVPAANVGTPSNSSDVPKDSGQL